MPLLFACLSVMSALADTAQHTHERLLRALEAASLEAEHVVATTTRATFHQGHHGEGIITQHAATDALRGRNGDQILRTVSRSLYPYEFRNEWSEFIDGTGGGRRKGGDTFGGRSGDLSPARLARRQKERLLSSPAMLVSETVFHAVERTESGLRVSGSWPGGALDLWLNDDATRLDEVCFAEDLPPAGDRTVCWRYRDWRGQPSAPHVLEQRIGETVVFREVRTLVERAAPPEVVHRAPESDTGATAFGWARWTWLADWMGYGFPQDETGISPAVSPRRVGKGITMVRGPFHNSLVVELGPDEVFVVEAPYSPEQADAVFDWIGAAWPHATIRGVALTHAHDDHAGGIRAVAERGLPLYVPEGSEEQVHGWLASPRTVRERPAAGLVAVHSVSAPVVIQGAERTLVLTPLPNEHVADLLLVSVPEARLAHVPDLLNPGLFPTRGLRGALVRSVVRRLSDYNLAKAGVYATSLEAGLEAARLDVRRFTGGHGPQVASRHAIQVMARSADEAAFAEWQALVRWPTE